MMINDAITLLYGGMDLISNICDVICTGVFLRFVK